MGRPPELQFRILFELAKNGRRAQKELVYLLATYPSDISDAVKELRDKQLLGKAERDISEMKSLPKGRRLEYINVNDKGLEFVLSRLNEPVLFWRTVLGFCYFNKKLVSQKSMEKFLKIFLRKFLNYTSVHEFILQLEDWNKICAKLYEGILQDDKEQITLDQKILELLSVKRGIELSELVLAVNQDKDKVEATLSKYLPIKHSPLLLSIENREDLISGKISVKARSDFDFQLHKIINVKVYTDGVQLYELTVFGIIFILYLIRNFDMGLSTKGLFNSLNFQEYFNKIAAKYYDKLPLIFGKWHKIIDCLEIMAMYNLDIVLYSDFRRESLLDSVNHKLYESIKDVCRESHEKVSTMNVQGFFEMTKFVREMEASSKLTADEIWKKISPVFELWTSMSILLDPIRYDPESCKIELKKDKSFSIESIERISNFYNVETIERGLANEITFLYYLNLNNEYNFQIKHVSRSFQGLVKDCKDSGGIHLFPKIKMLSLIGEDEEIKQFINSRVIDAMRYIEGVHRSLKNFREDIDSTGR